MYPIAFGIKRESFWHKQERDGSIVQTTYEQNDQERGDKNRTTILHVIPFIVPFLCPVLVRPVDSSFIVYTVFLSDWLAQGLKMETKQF
jgi:hypothetical protein